MAVVFVLGYCGIVFEESVVFNKAGVGLLLAVALWVIRSICVSGSDVANDAMTRSTFFSKDDVRVFLRSCFRHAGRALSMHHSPQTS